MGQAVVIIEIPFLTDSGKINTPFPACLRTRMHIRVAKFNFYIFPCIS